MKEKRMNWEIFIEWKLVQDLGWTLIHSVWQIALISAVLFLALKAFTKLSAGARYVLSVSALVLAFILPAMTFIQFSGSPAGAISPTAGYEQAITGKTDINRLHSEAVESPAGDPAAIPSPGQAPFLSFASALQNFFDRNLAHRIPLAVGLWLLGLALFTLRLTGGIWQLHRYKTQDVSPPEADWQLKFELLCERLGVPQPVRFLTSNLVETPIVAGWLKPVILVPASLFLQIHPRELEIIIAHELIHIRRYDPLVNLAQSAMEILFFYHPCIWWLSAHIRKEREFAADARVLEIFSDSHLTYANALANLEEIRLLTNNHIPSIATAANGGNLMQRIQKILQKNTETRITNSAWSAGLAVLLISAVLITVFSFNSTVFVNAQNKTKNRKLAIGFVSIPPVDRSENPPRDADATARIMIAKLTQYKVPAVGFVNGGSISDGEKLFPVRANIVRLWRDAGLEVGIGSFKHVWFYHTPYDEYVAGVEKNEDAVRKILAEKNLPLRYFSYPYLNTGKRVEDRDRFEAWLEARGINSVKYTIDNNEWMYSYAYDIARNDNDIGTMTEVRVAFMNYMSKMFDHYEAYSQDLFGRDINQTMVLTPSRLAADSFDDLFGMIQKRGYKFVTMEEAQADAAYKTRENFVGNSGISWFERWSLEGSKSLRAEPRVSEEVQKIWDKMRPKAK
jgi:beta-lactamase regulating signal transducer with metallopeptidase domain/peptidoglycan/xylan/chitin deacetylase (PgdA/CDA1 family)